MTIAASTIILRAQQLLSDIDTPTRWKADELVRWLNDGQREIVLQRPDANPRTVTATLAAGTRQTLVGMTGVSSPAKLIDVHRNMASASNLQAVRMVPRKVLDAQVPGWHAETQAISVKNVTFDPREPLVFYVYPPAKATSQLEVTYAQYPTDIAAPSGDSYSTVTGNIGVVDLFASALLDYVMFRAFLKDSEFAGNLPRASAHYTAFATSLGLELKGTLEDGPR